MARALQAHRSVSVCARASIAKCSAWPSQANQAEHMLNWLDVTAGEMFYVDAGTVTPLGPNSIIIETQQNCDITYRLYDYGRPRELHLERGMAAIQEDTHAGRVEPQPVEGTNCFSSPSFTVERYKINAPVDACGDSGRGSVQVLVSWMAERWSSAPGLRRLPSCAAKPW